MRGADAAFRDSSVRPVGYRQRTSNRGTAGRDRPGIRTAMSTRHCGLHPTPTSKQSGEENNTGFSPSPWGYEFPGVEGPGFEVAPAATHTSRLAGAAAGNMPTPRFPGRYAGILEASLVWCGWVLGASLLRCSIAFEARDFVELLSSFPCGLLGFPGWGEQRPVEPGPCRLCTKLKTLENGAWLGGGLRAGGCDALGFSSPACSLSFCFACFMMMNLRGVSREAALRLACSLRLVLRYQQFTA